MSQFALHPQHSAPSRSKWYGVHICLGLNAVSYLYAKAVCMIVLTCFGKESAEALIGICSFTLFGQVSVRLTMNISMFGWLQDRTTWNPLEGFAHLNAMLQAVQL